MKIAISTGKGGMDDAVVPVFGRCGSFTIVEIEGDEIRGSEVVPNQATQSPSGAGIQASQTMVNTGVESVITGNIGPNSMMVLKQAGIKVFSGAGMKVEEAVKAYLEGKLQEISDSTVPGGAGMGLGMGRGTGMGRGQGRGQGAGRR
ncbi:MAG: NifB/NifX family molybdenum-iron cluster-binding protein [Candidatus Aenigmarchaeota archaeon]|nr:NifB/NifX family molybdenum-iron cluster-binding protein [Candidatus Aenigmarchaeota archaeon]